MTHSSRFGPNSSILGSPRDLRAGLHHHTSSPNAFIIQNAINHPTLQKVVPGEPSALDLSDRNLMILNQFYFLWNHAQIQVQNLRNIVNSPEEKSNHFSLVGKETLRLFTALWSWQRQYHHLLTKPPASSGHSPLTPSKIGKLASQIAQVYFFFYIKTCDFHHISAAYEFYALVAARNYYTIDSFQISHLPNIISRLYTHLRFLLRFSSVCLLSNQISSLSFLEAQFSEFIGFLNKLVDNTSNPSSLKKLTVLIAQTQTALSNLKGFLIEYTAISLRFSFSTAFPFLLPTPLKTFHLNEEDELIAENKTSPIVSNKSTIPSTVPVVSATTSTVPPLSNTSPQSTPKVQSRSQSPGSPSPPIILTNFLLVDTPQSCKVSFSEFTVSSVVLSHLIDFSQEFRTLSPSSTDGHSLEDSEASDFESPGDISPGPPQQSIPLPQRASPSPTQHPQPQTSQQHHNQITYPSSSTSPANIRLLHKPSSPLSQNSSFAIKRKRTLSQPLNPVIFELLDNDGDIYDHSDPKSPSPNTFLNPSSGSKTNKSSSISSSPSNFSSKIVRSSTTGPSCLEKNNSNGNNFNSSTSPHSSKSSSPNAPSKSVGHNSPSYSQSLGRTSSPSWLNSVGRRSTPSPPNALFTTNSKTIGHGPRHRRPGSTPFHHSLESRTFSRRKMKKYLPSKQVASTTGTGTGTGNGNATTGASTSPQLASKPSSTSPPNSSSGQQTNPPSSPPSFSFSFEILKSYCHSNPRTEMKIPDTRHSRVHKEFLSSPSYNSFNMRLIENIKQSNEFTNLWSSQFLQPQHSLVSGTPLPKPPCAGLCIYLSGVTARNGGIFLSDTLTIFPYDLISYLVQTPTFLFVNSANAFEYASIFEPIKNRSKHHGHHIFILSQNEEFLPRFLSNPLFSIFRLYHQNHVVVSVCMSLKKRIDTFFDTLDLHFMNDFEADSAEYVYKLWCASPLGKILVYNMILLLTLTHQKKFDRVLTKPMIMPSLDSHLYDKWASTLKIGDLFRTLSVYE